MWICPVPIAMAMAMAMAMVMAVACTIDRTIESTIDGTIAIGIGKAMTCNWAYTNHTLTRTPNRTLTSRMRYTRHQPLAVGDPLATAYSVRGCGLLAARRQRFFSFFSKGEGSIGTPLPGCLPPYCYRVASMVGT